MAEETVTISRREYDSLIHDAHELSVLEAAGVDNSSSADYACTLRREMPCPCRSCSEERE